ncbi:MAG: hypothetical protein QW812_05310, partial [Thermoplasmataceae archaeon]
MTENSRTYRNGIRYAIGSAKTAVLILILLVLILYSTTLGPVAIPVDKVMYILLSKFPLFGNYVPHNF